MTGDKEPIDARRKFVRITGERNGFVEFEFGMGDLSLAIELILPPDAFAEFCTSNDVEMVSEKNSADQDDAERAMSWRPSDVQRQF